MTHSDIWLFIVPFTIAAAVPGPVQGALVAHVMVRGSAAIVPFVVGIVLGNSLWLAAAILGLSALAVRLAVVFAGIKWLGVAYLVFVAWKLWTGDPVSAEVHPRGVKRPGVPAGAALTLGNPKAVVFYSAVLPQAFDLTQLSFAQLPLILALGLVIDVSVQTAYVAAASRAGALVRSATQMRVVNRSAAGLMFGSAAWIASRR